MTWDACPENSLFPVKINVSAIEIYLKYFVHAIRDLHKLQKRKWACRLGIEDQLN